MAKSASRKNKQEFVSEKNLPSVTINREGFKYYFQKSINDLLGENDSLNIGNQTFAEFVNRHSKGLDNERENRNTLIITNYYKLLDNIHCVNDSKKYKTVNFKETEYYKYIQTNFIEKLLEKPIFFTLLLLPLLRNDFIRNGFLAKYKESKEDKNVTNSTLIADKNRGVFDKYVEFLNGQFEIAGEIFDGVFELAKNIVEHSENKEGKIAIKLIKHNELSDKNKENKKLWDDYFDSIKDVKFSDEENKNYLEISIADTGTVGIIETSLKNMEDAGNFRKIPEDIIEYDRNKIQQGIESSAGDGMKEAKLLFEMYFGGNKSLLNRQANNSFKGLGIYLFTKFINDNHGIFSVQTNKFQRRNETINFSFYNKSGEINPAFVNPEVFGTRYNIIIPLQKKKGDVETEKNTEKRDTILSKGVYEKMLPLEKYAMQQESPLGELDQYNISKYVIRNYISDQEKIIVLSLNHEGTENTPFKIDRCMLFRTISQLFVNNESVNAIIIKDAAEDLITGLFNIYAALTSSKDEDKGKKESIYFPSNKMVLLLTEDKKGAVIAGQTENECKKINQYIADKNGYFEALPKMCTNIDRTEKEKINKNLDDHILFSSGQLIALNFFEKGDAYFEENAKIKLKNSLDIGGEGYNWQQTHLKIGSKLHLDDFVYGKKMFQRSGEASNFAFSIARDIFENIQEEIKNSSQQTVYTLVGYGYYSELLVSRTREFVKHLLLLDGITEDKIKVEYIIIKDEEKIKFSRYIHNFQARKNKNTLEELIIIVPISSTLTTCLKIENAFYKELEEKRKEEKDEKNEYGKDRFKVRARFYTTVIVGDRIDAEEIPEQLENDQNNHFNTIRKCWKGAKAEDKIIFTENREVKEKIISDTIEKAKKEPGNISEDEKAGIKAQAEKEAKRENQYNIYIQSIWQLPESCAHCFPEKPIQERPLFVTDKVSVTPSLIFEPPKWYKSEQSEMYKPYFKLDKDTTPLEEISLPIINKIDWVHYTGDSNKHFNYYLHYLDFIRDNEKKLRYEANPENWVKIIRDNLTEDREKRVLLIAPDKSENGAFIHLINREIFDDRAEIIRFDKHSDHYLNFDKFFRDKIDDWADAIYFVDNLMSSGKTFLSVDDILKVSQERKQEENQNVEPKRIKGVFCLINRMDYSCYHTVVARLEENNVKLQKEANTDDKKKSNKKQISEDKENYFYSFTQLNVPESVVIPCPLCDEKTKYEELKDSVSLDCIKQYFVKKEILYFKEVNKEDLTEDKLPYKPLNRNHSSTLLRVILIHFLNKAFAENHDCIERFKTEKIPNWDKKDNFSEYIDFNSFVDNFRDYISIQKQCCIKGKNEKEKDDIINDLKFKANLIKVLSSQSLKKYRGVYISVFYWVLCELIVVARTILGEKYDFKRRYDVLTKKENTNKLTDFGIFAESDTDFYKREEIDTCIDTVNYLRTLIKYASSLNIAYLLHQDFLAAINRLINRKDEITKKIQNGSDQLEAEDRDQVKSKYNEMSYSFQNFKLFCAAHIVRSLHKNEQRAIQFEKNINSLYSKLKGEDTTFLELLTLENTSIIRQTLDNIENVCELDPNDPRLDDFFAFWEVKKEENRNSENEKFKHLKCACNIRKIIRNYEKNSEDNQTDYGNDVEINDIINNIAQIIGCNKTGGGILLYKYKHLKGDKESENYRVLGKYGDDSDLSRHFENPQTNNFSTKFLEGITYLREKSIKYKWTNYAIHKNKDNVWVGQDGKQIKFTDIQEITAKANRILFIRISSYHKNKGKEDNKSKEELKGEAVFVFYDNQCRYDTEGNAIKPDSVHDTRFVHILRNEISKYLNDKYQNDAFKAWVEGEKKRKDMLSTEHHNRHHLKDWFFAMKENNQEKGAFFWSQVNNANAIKEFMESGDISIFEDIENFNVKDKINNCCKFLFEENVYNATSLDGIPNDLQICFSEMLFQEIICEYLKNINNNTRLFTHPQVCLDIKISIEIMNQDIEFTIKNNYWLFPEGIQNENIINLNGHLTYKKGLYSNKILLTKIGSETPHIHSEETSIDRVRNFIVKFKLKNIDKNEDN